MATTTTPTNSTAPKITFWTNPDSFWAHRLEIAMKELNLAYEEVHIDLSQPREEWFLKINPKGQVPTLRYSNGPINNEILTESAVIAQFLADAHPSHLLPASGSSPTAPLFRARVNFFLDTYSTKVNPSVFAMYGAATEEEKEQKSQELVGAMEKEIEPLLENANPFFGGSAELTLVEVQCAPLILRLYDFADGHILAASLPASLDKLPNFAKWAKACRTHDSVVCNWDAELRRVRARESIARYKARAAAAAAEAAK